MAFDFSFPDFQNENRETEMKSNNYEKLLWVKIDSKVAFNEHLNYFIDKSSLKVNPLSRVVPYMNESKKCILKNQFLVPQFSFCLFMDVSQSYSEP